MSKQAIKPYTVNTISKKGKISHDDFYKINHSSYPKNDWEIETKIIENKNLSENPSFKNGFEQFILEYSNLLVKQLDRKVDVIFSKILEVNQNNIIVKSLIESGKNKNFQKRKFDLAPLRHLHLSVNDILKIQIVTIPGERRYIYTKDNSYDLSKFDNTNYQPNIRSSKIFKQIKIKNDNNF